MLSLNTYKEAVKFQKYRDILGNCKIYLFDEECSYLGANFASSVCVFRLNRCEHIASPVYGYGSSV